MVIKLMKKAVDQIPGGHGHHSVIFHSLRKVVRDHPRRHYDHKRSKAAKTEYGPHGLLRAYSTYVQPSVKSHLINHGGVSGSNPMSSFCCDTSLWL